VFEKWLQKMLSSDSLRVHWHQTENLDLRSWVQTPAHASNFSTPDCKQINNKAPSVTVIVTRITHRRVYGRTLIIKVLTLHQHHQSLYCTKLLLFGCKVMVEQISVLIFLHFLTYKSCICILTIKETKIDKC